MHKIYIRGYRKSSVEQKMRIELKDIAEISAPNHLREMIEKLVVIEVEENIKKIYTVSIIEIIQMLNERFEDIVIYNVGEKDMIVEYLSEPVKYNPIIEWSKVFIACSIIFAGATIAIMAYQSDISLAKTFTALNRVFTGQVDTNPLWITIPYSLGIPIGVLVFFNHIGTKRITDDPTPIEVEINSYEKEVEDTTVDTINQKRRGEQE